MTLILGIDDAGRGPVIGPMILAGVLLTKEQEKTIKRAGAADSKLLFHSQRIKISKIIKQNSLSNKVIKVFPEEIDKTLKSANTNLNKLEAQKSAQIINALNKGKNSKERIQVIIDCPSVNTNAWKNLLTKYITNISNLTIICEHKADFKYASVSAASILAKVAREEEMDKIREEYKEYGNVGSGYPSDTVTQSFLKDNGLKLHNRGIFRKTWSTYKNLFPDKKQAKLFDF